MRDEDKSKKQLIRELDSLRQQVSQLENGKADRKNIEERLQESEERWQFALEGAGDGVWDWNAQTNEVYFSRQWKRMLGYENHEIGNTLDEWDRRAHPDDRKQVYAEIDKHFRGESPVYLSEHRVRCKDGTYMWILDRGKVISWTQDGKPLRMIGTHTDITGHKKAEEALRQQREFLEILLETIPNPIFYKDADGKYTGCNKAFEEFLGQPRQEIIGKTVYDLAPRGIADRYDQKDRELLDQPGQQHYEWRVRRKNGEIRDVIFHKAAILDKEGRIEGVLGVILDITERKRAENELRQSQQKLTDIINFLPDATLVIDKEGKIIAWNRAIEGMTGVVKEDILGKGDYAYAVPFYGEPRPILIDTVLKSSTEQAGHYDFIERRGDEIYAEAFAPNVYSGKGAHIWITASPLYDGEGNLIGAIESIRDISERKEIESALQQREKTLENKTHQLEEMNAALNVLLRKRLDDQNELQESVLSNLKEMVIPYLEKVKQSQLNETQKTYIGILESHLTEILSPFLKNISTKFANLTPTEIQVAGLVKDGKTSKEIAQLLGVAQKTVSAHRYNLRIKLGLKNEKMNLRSHLLSLL